MTSTPLGVVDGACRSRERGAHAVYKPVDGLCWQGARGGQPLPPPVATHRFLLTISTHGAPKGFSRAETWGVGSIGKIQIDLSTNTTTVKPPCYVAHNGKIAWDSGARWGPKMPKCGILGKMCIKKEPR